MQWCHLVDVSRDAVVVDGDVKAFGGDVLAQRDHPAVVQTADPAVAMKPPADVEMVQERDGVRDRRRVAGLRAGDDLRVSVGRVVIRLAGFQARLQRGRLFAAVVGG